MEHPTPIATSPETRGETEPQGLPELADIDFTDEELLRMTQPADLDFLALLGMC